jgi:hypothetical protein
MMQEFKLDFIFNHVHHTASVSVIKRPDHIQYTIVPDDPALEKRFATQVVHRFGEKFDFAFPDKGEDGRHYNKALEKALKQSSKQHI